MNIEISSIGENSPAGPLGKSRKGTTIVSVYLLLWRQEEICLLLRKNTGYYDGWYGLIAGHVEDGESAIQGMIRESYEEAGIVLDSSQMSMVHTMHRKTKEGRLGIDIFFAANSWEGKLENKEPHKYEELAFFSRGKFPPNTIPYVAEAIQLSGQGRFYSECGWA